METDCNLVYDGSPDGSVEEEEEEEEEAQEHQLSSSLQKLNQNERVKSKLSDALDPIQSEDSGLTWETSSSRCSTSLASETSATSDIYSMENSYTDCLPGKVIFPTDDGKTLQKRTNNSPDQVPLSPDEKIDTMSRKHDFSSQPMQIKGPERELDAADPHSWPFQVQPSKIKEYLVQITHEVVISVSEEKENALIKKGELPLKGTVRSRIEQITAVLEERNKKIFRRVNQKDVPPPFDVIRRPRQQPQIFSRKGISVSLRHIEREPPDKHKKKDVFSYNLRHVETNNKEEKQVQRSFQPETIRNMSERLPVVSSLLANRTRKLESKLYSYRAQNSAPEQAIVAPPNHHKNIKEEEIQPFFDGTANIMLEKAYPAEVGELNMEPSQVAPEVTDIVEATKAAPERETDQLYSYLSAKPSSSPAQERKDQPNATPSDLSKQAAENIFYLNNIAAAKPQLELSVLPDIRNQDTESAIPSQLEIKLAVLLNSPEEAGRQNIPLNSPEAVGSEQEEWSIPVGAAGKEEMEASYSKEEEVQDHPALLLQTEREHVYSGKEPEAREKSTIHDLMTTTSELKTQESQRNLYQTTIEHLGLPQRSYLMDEAQQKENEQLESDLAEELTQAERSKTVSLESEQTDVSSSKGKAEKETADIKCPDVPLSIPSRQRKDMHQLTVAVTQSESKEPVISEITKASGVSELTELSLFKDKEVGPYTVAEAPGSFEQLLSMSSNLTENGEEEEALPSSLGTATQSSEELKSVLQSIPEAAEEQSHILYSPGKATSEPTEKQGPVPCSPETVLFWAEAGKKQIPLPYSPDTVPITAEPVEKQSSLHNSSKITTVMAEPMEKQGYLIHSSERASVVSEPRENLGTLPHSPETTLVVAERIEEQGLLPCSPETASVLAEPMEKQGLLPYPPETAPVLAKPMEKQGLLPYSPEKAPTMAEPTEKQRPVHNLTEIVPAVSEPMEEQGPLPYSPETPPVVAEPVEQESHLHDSADTVTAVAEPMEKIGSLPYSLETADTTAECVGKQSLLHFSFETSPMEKIGSLSHSSDTTPIVVEPMEKQSPLHYSPETAPVMAEIVEQESYLLYSADTAPVVAEPMAKQGLLLYSPETVPFMAESVDERKSLPYSLDTGPVIAEPVEKQECRPCSPEKSPAMAELTEIQRPLHNLSEIMPVVSEPMEKQSHLPYSQEIAPIIAEPVEIQRPLPYFTETTPVVEEPMELKGPLSYSPVTPPVMAEPREQERHLRYSADTAPVIAQPVEKQGSLLYSPETAPVIAEPVEKQELLPYSPERAPTMAEPTEKQRPLKKLSEIAPVVSEPMEKQDPLPYSPEIAHTMAEPVEKQRPLPYLSETCPVVAEPMVAEPMEKLADPPHSPETTALVTEPIEIQGPLSYSSETPPVTAEPMEKQGPLRYSADTAPVFAEQVETQGLLPYSPEEVPAMAEPTEKQRDLCNMSQIVPVVSEPMDKQGPLPYSQEISPVLAEPVKQERHLHYSADIAPVVAEPIELKGPLSNAPKTSPALAEPSEKRRPLHNLSEIVSVASESMEKLGSLPYSPERTPLVSDLMEIQGTLSYSPETPPVMAEPVGQESHLLYSADTAPVIAEPIEKQGLLLYSPKTAPFMTESMDERNSLPYSLDTGPVIAEPVEKQEPLNYYPEKAPAMAELIEKQRPLHNLSEIAPVVSEPMEKQGPLPYSQEIAPIMAEPVEIQRPLPYSTETTPVVAEPTEKQRPLHNLSEIAPVASESMEKLSCLPYSPETTPLVSDPMEIQGPLSCSPETPPVMLEPVGQESPLCYSSDIAPVTAEPMEKQILLPYSPEEVLAMEERTEKQRGLHNLSEIAPLVSEPMEKQGHHPYPPETALLMAEPVEEQSPLPYSAVTAAFVAEPVEIKGPLLYSPEIVPDMAGPMRKLGSLSHSPETTPLVTVPMEKQGPLFYSPETPSIISEPVEKKGLLSYSPEKSPATADPTEKQTPLHNLSEIVPVVSEPMEEQGSLPYSPETAHVMAETVEQESHLLYSADTATAIAEPMEEQEFLLYYPEADPFMAELVDERNSLPYSLDTGPVTTELVEKQEPLPYFPEKAPVMTEPTEKKRHLHNLSEIVSVVPEPIEEQDLLPYSPETAPVMEELMEQESPLCYFADTAPVVAEQMEKQGLLPYSPAEVPATAESTEEQRGLHNLSEIAPVVSEPMEEQGPPPYSPETPPVLAEPVEKESCLCYSADTAPVVAETVEKQGLLPYSPEKAPATAELTEKQQPLPNLSEIAPVVSEPIEEQGPLPYSPETSHVAETFVVIQSDEVTKGGIQPLLPMEVSSEDGMPLSRDPDVRERKTAQLVSRLSPEHLPSAVSMLPQEEKSESQFHPPVNGKLNPVDEEESYLTICPQKGQFPSSAITLFELDHLAESESRKQTMKQDSFVSSQLAETITLPPVDEADTKSTHPEKSTTKPLNTDSLHPAYVLKEQHSAQMADEDTTQQLSNTHLSTETDILQSVEETKIDALLPHLPATAEDLSWPVYLMETQEDQHFSTGLAALDSETLGIPDTTAGAKKWNSMDTQSKDSMRQAMEAEYQNVSLSTVASGNSMNMSVPSASTEEDDLQSPRFVIPELINEHPVSSERDREDNELYSVITSASTVEHPIVGPETKGSQGFSCDMLKEVSKPPPLISSLVHNQIKDRGVLTESVSSSSQASEQLGFVSSHIKGKVAREERQCPVTPKMKETQTLTSLLVGETRAQLPRSSMASETVHEESSSILENLISRGVDDMASSSLLLPAAQLPNKIISAYSAAEGEKEEQTLPLNGELKSTKDIRNQESSLSLPPLVTLSSQDQEQLYYKEEDANQERTTLETESSKEQGDALKLSILQQELEHLNSMWSAERTQAESIQPYSSAAAQDSSQLTETRGTEEHQGSLPETEEVESGVAVLPESMGEAKVKQIHSVCAEAEQLKHKSSVSLREGRGDVPNSPVASPLDLEHLDSTYYTETQSSSPEAQNKASEQKPPVDPLKKMEKQEVNSCPSEVSVISALSQSSPTLVGIPEEDEKLKLQPPDVENTMSLAAFLLSEANTIGKSSPLTSEKENVDTQICFVEAGLLTERSAFAAPSEIGITIEKKTEPSTIPLEAGQFASKLQQDVSSRHSVQDTVENISDIPALPNFFHDEFSSIVTSKPINDTHAQNLSPSASSIVSQTMGNKDVIGTEDLAKIEGEKCIFQAEESLKAPEKHFTKEEKIRKHEDLKESIPAPELSQEKRTVDISESYGVVSIDAPPLISSLGTKEDANVLESLEYLETASLLKVKLLNNDGDVADDYEVSVCKLSGDASKGLKAENHEHKGDKSKEHIGKTSIQEGVETKLDVSIILENTGDDMASSDIDYIEEFILIDDTSVTQMGKEKSIEEVQSSFEVKNEMLEETPSSQRDLGGAFQGVVKGKNVTVTQEDTSKVSDKDKIIYIARENGKKLEGEVNLTDTDVLLSNMKEDSLSQSSLISLPVAAVKSDDLEGPPALTVSYHNLYEAAAEESKEDVSTSQSDMENVSTALPTHIRDYASGDRTGILPKKDISNNYTPNSLEEIQNEQVLEDQSMKQQALRQSVYETNEEEHGLDHILAETYAQTEVLSPSKIEDDLRDKMIEVIAEIESDITVKIATPTHAIPFGSGLNRSGANRDDSSQAREESMAEETGHMSPEETSDEESSPILDYAASVHQNETSVQDESRDVPFTVDQSQQCEVMEVHEVDPDVIRKPAEESTQHLEAYQDVNTHRQSEGQEENKLVSVLEPMPQDVHALDHEHSPCWGDEGLTYEKVGDDLMEHSTEPAEQPVSEAKYDRPFGDLDYSLLSHDFDTYPLYSIKEEEYSEEEDLAELMDYEIVKQNDVFQAETFSEAACEELLFEDSKSLDQISDSYEFVNEREANTDAEEEVFELMEPDKLPRIVPESEILQKEIEQLDSYCCHCRCPLSAEDKLSRDHKGHDVTDLDTSVKVLKSQLDGFQDVLQERSIKIEKFVSEIEDLFNSLEENCKEKEQHLEEQNESIVKMVIDHHDRKAQSFEGIKNTKMEYLYEQMVNFQEYIDTAKETLETVIKQTEEMDDFVFLQSSEEINKRLLSAVENILTLEKIPDTFSQFEHYAGDAANGDQTLKHTPVPQTPKLQPQEPNSATSTSIAVYWTVDEDAVIDFFQVYCMEECLGNKEQSGLVEEYRVTVKESNCILEDLEPGHSYSVWIMAVNYTGCSFPSDKSTFRTAPLTPVIKAEECTICWDTATIRWSTSNLEATDSFTLEYCRQYSPEGEGLREEVSKAPNQPTMMNDAKAVLLGMKSLAGIKRPEMKIQLESNVNYFFYVRAVNLFGTSEQSEAALISTKGTRFHVMRETAQSPLYVSPNGTMICLPENSKLTETSPILGELLSAHGWHYWEITVSHCEAYKVGICHSYAPQDSILGQNSTSWCFHGSSKTSFMYKVLHNGEMSDVLVTEHPARIGILLDYNAGRLLFFNAERGQVLSTIRHKFTNAAHPAFVLEQPGVLNLHTGMELPEFAKQS